MGAGSPAELVADRHAPSAAAADRPRLKVCCIGDLAEAALAVRYGASAIGLVSAMPSGPGVIDEERIAEIAAWVPPGVASVLLTSSQDPADIVAAQRRLAVDAIQLCDRLETGEVMALRRRLPGVKLIQVVHVVDESAVDRALQCSEEAHALLLDSGNPDTPVKELGGTGREHDWSISRRIRDAVRVPVFLAGGLNPDNVGSAVARVRPYGVDVCTGLRARGRLSEERLAAFVRRLDAVGSGGGTV